MSTATSPPPQQQPLRIFVVEDHADTMSVIVLYLQRLGHQVFHANTVTEALAAIPSAKCDVLISDVGLPDGNGWELLSRLKQEGRPHPDYGIVISGFGTNSDRAKSEAAGYRQHLLKPFNPRDLRAALETATRSIRQEREEGQR
jgi:two-component system CheB/CheR fusion protein